MSRYFIKINGQDIPESLKMAIGYFEHESNDELLDRLILRFNDPDGTIQDNELLQQGNEIEFSYGQDERVMSEPQTFTLRRVMGKGVLEVTAYEKMHRIAQNSRSRIHRNATISEIATFMARENGLRAKAGNFPLRYVQLAQVNETDLHFLKRIGKRVNAIAIVEGGALVFEKKQFTGQPVTSYFYDEHVASGPGVAMNFRPIETNLGIPWEVTMAGMNPLTMEVYEMKSNDQTVNRAVLGEETLLYSGATGTPQARAGQTGMRIAATAYNPLEAKTEGDAMYQAYESDVLKGTVELWGDADVQTNKIIEFKGVTNRFTGLYRVKKARHIIKGSYKILATVERNAVGVGIGGKRSSGTIRK